MDTPSPPMQRQSAPPPAPPAPAAPAPASAPADSSPMIAPPQATKSTIAPTTRKTAEPTREAATMQAGEAAATPRVNANGLSIIICADCPAGQARYSAPRPRATGSIDRKSVVTGKSVSVRVDLGGRRILKTKKTQTIQH